MKLSFSICSVIILSLAATVCARTPTTRKAGKAPPKTISGARTEVYKRIGDVELRIHIFEPEGHKPSDQSAAIVFFFGGGWQSGSPTQFIQQCRYLASRGMVAMTAEYRVHSRHRVKIFQCVQDAKSAVRWVRANAKRLGIDPHHIAAGGGSAGGHLAAATGTIKGFEDSKDDPAVSSRPDAMVLFNPALDLTAEGFEWDDDNERYAAIAKRMGAPAKELSPTFQVTSGAPPTIIFHGKQDTTVPYAQVEAFAKAMKDAHNRCDVVGFERQGHGFFNYGRDGQRFFRETMLQTDRFFESLGYIKGQPTIDDFLKKAETQK